MTDALELLWPLVDSPDSLVSAHVAASWPTGVHGRLGELGLLCPAADASRVLCPECGEHLEEVWAIDGPEGCTRFVIPCPVVMRADVPSAAMRQWTVDHEHLAAALARTLALTGKCTELVAGRLWRLGRTQWNGKSRDAFFARGLHWNDGETVRGVLVRGRKPIVFVALKRPPSEFWRTVPPVLVLSHVAALGDAGIEIELLEIAAAIHEADASASSAIGPMLTREHLKRMIRQQVKAEMKTQLNDDIYLAAYRQCGSVREAATFLSTETEREVSKDQVHRALGRAGGAAAVLNGEDSDSVVRGVASQGRDKHGKPIIRAQPSTQA